jgi:hypothetical protein
MRDTFQHGTVAQVQVPIVGAGNGYLGHGRSNTRMKIRTVRSPDNLFPNLPMPLGHLNLFSHVVFKCSTSLDYSRSPEKTQVVMCQDRKHYYTTYCR